MTSSPSNWNKVSVLSLGGAGAMGRVAVETIKKFDTVGRIVIADLDGEKATELAGQLGDKVEGCALDAMDFDALVSKMKEFDYVISTLGPYYKFGAHVLKAAIEAKIDYIDICDDPEPTLDILALNAEAKKAGIRALVGAGASPGISNMLAAIALDKVDDVETLYTGWGANKRTDENETETAATEGASAAVEHWVQQLTGKIRVREGGINVDRAPLERHILPHPTGGSCAVYSLGHPEPVTFAKYYPHIVNSYNVMDMSDFVISILHSVRRKVDSGKLTIREAAIYLEGITNNTAISFTDLCRYGYHTIVEILRGKKYMPDLHATVIGKKAGQPKTVSTWMNGRIKGGMGPMTCIPTAVFLSMMIDGCAKRTGVFAPEHAFDPEEFFRRLSPYITKDDANLPLVLSSD